MRDALIAAAKASSGELAQMILKSKARPKTDKRGWKVDRRGKKNGGRNR